MYNLTVVSYLSNFGNLITIENVLLLYQIGTLKVNILDIIFINIYCQTHRLDVKT
jgi:hypothetical protein